MRPGVFSLESFLAVAFAHVVEDAVHLGVVAGLLLGSLAFLLGEAGVLVAFHLLDLADEGLEAAEEPAVVVPEAGEGGGLVLQEMLGGEVI